MPPLQLVQNHRAAATGLREPVEMAINLGEGVLCGAAAQGSGE